MRSKFLALLILTGCAASHTQDRLDNAGIAAEYGKALDDCVSAAIATFQTTGDMAQAQTDYDTCATAADEKYGKK